MTTEWLITIITGQITLGALIYGMYNRYQLRKETIAKENSVGSEALRRQNEKIEQLKEQIQDLREEIRKNWQTFYEIQSKK